jgi:hypothetical protein
MLANRDVLCSLFENQVNACRYRIGRPGAMLSAAATMALASMP